MVSAQNSKDIIYRGIINKEYLRVNPDMLRTLYGDEPPMEWTMVGQVTYIPHLESCVENVNEKTDECAESSISDSYQNIFKSYKHVEKVFFGGKKKIRIHVAPLAIYTETSHN